MLRCLVLAAAIYAFGHPALEAYRPAPFERSLREFHRDINRIAEATWDAAATFDRGRALRSFETLSVRLQAMQSAR